MTSAGSLRLTHDAHTLFEQLLHMQFAGDTDGVRALCRVLRKHLPKGLRRKLSWNDLVSVAAQAVFEGQGRICVCCAVDVLLEAADADVEAHACTHNHADYSAPGNYGVRVVIQPVTVTRIATAMVKPTPARYAAARYKSPSPSDSDSGSDSSGPVRRSARLRASASPYARPSPPPRKSRSSSRAVDALADRVAAVDLSADPDMDGLARSLARSAIAELGTTVYTQPVWPRTRADAYAY